MDSISFFSKGVVLAALLVLVSCSREKAEPITGEAPTSQAIEAAQTTNGEALPPQANDEDVFRQTYFDDKEGPNTTGVGFRAFRLIMEDDVELLECAFKQFDEVSDDLLRADMLLNTSSQHFLDFTEIIDDTHSACLPNQSATLLGDSETKRLMAAGLQSRIWDTMNRSEKKQFFVESNSTYYPALEATYPRNIQVYMYDAAWLERFIDAWKAGQLNDEGLAVTLDALLSLYWSTKNEAAFSMLLDNGAMELAVCSGGHSISKQEDYRCFSRVSVFYREGEYWPYGIGKISEFAEEHVTFLLRNALVHRREAGVDSQVEFVQHYMKNACKQSTVYLAHEGEIRTGLSSLSGADGDDWWFSKRFEGFDFNETREELLDKYQSSKNILFPTLGIWARAKYFSTGHHLDPDSYIEIHSAMADISMSELTDRIIADIMTGPQPTPEDAQIARTVISYFEDFDARYHSQLSECDHTFGEGDPVSFLTDEQWGFFEPVLSFGTRKDIDEFIAMTPNDIHAQFPHDANANWNRFAVGEARIDSSP